MGEAQTRRLLAADDGAHKRGAQESEIKSPGDMAPVLTEPLGKPSTEFTSPLSSICRQEYARASALTKAMSGRGVLPAEAVGSRTLARPAPKLRPYGQGQDQLFVFISKGFAAGQQFAAAAYNLTVALSGDIRIHRPPRGEHVGALEPDHDAVR